MALRSGVLRVIVPRVLVCATKPSRLLLPVTNVLTRYRKFCQGFSSTVPRSKSETVKLYFVHRDGTKEVAKATTGDNLLDVIIENQLDIDGFGACEGTLSCSTCHLIFKPEDYNKLPDKPSDEELDMLDLAYDLTDTSRLGCQVTVTKDMEGWEIRVPADVADARGPS